MAEFETPDQRSMNFCRSHNGELSFACSQVEFLTVGIQSGFNPDSLKNLKQVMGKCTVCKNSNHPCSVLESIGVTRFGDVSIIESEAVEEGSKDVK